MARLWEIRESYGERKSPEYKEAYECGYEEGYADAMEELKSSSMGERHGRYGMRSGEDEGMMGERRMRGSNGRYR